MKMLCWAEKQPAEYTLERIAASVEKEICLPVNWTNDIHEKLEYIISRLATNQYTEFAKQLILKYLVRSLSNRAIFDTCVQTSLVTPIDNPVFIVGLPRSGTTFLLNLLSCDERFRSLKIKESQIPFRREGLSLDRFARQRDRAAFQYFKALDTAFPQLAAIHKYSENYACEDNFLLDLDLFAEPLVNLGGFTKSRDRFSKSRAVSALNVYKKSLCLLGLGATQRWLLKNPLHYGYIEELSLCFPDAVFIVLKRDREATLNSFITMKLLSERMVKREPSVTGIIAEAQETVNWFEERFENSRNVLTSHNSVVVEFDELRTDYMSILARIYNKLGLEFGTDLQTSISQNPAFISKNQKSSIRLSRQLNSILSP
ncbi:sulfotransferase family protein [Catenovulum sediminis]|uniref:Sulfotransferase n=1 Tax=Catenovulum sediminis TaxID=1740262 RepID=A0ABV1RG74_9ALTE